MSKKSEIRQARLDAELRFEAAKHPDPQAYYRKTKNRNAGISLIIVSPLGLIFFGGIGMAIAIGLGIFLLIASAGE